MEEENSPLVDYAPYPRRSALSFGLEIEFALATAPISGIDPEPQLGRQIFGMPDWESACENVRKTLEGVGIPAEVDDRAADKWAPQNQKSWSVKEDATIMAPDKAYEWVKIELCSPPFYFTPGSLEQVRLTLETLAKTYRISCNRSCGLHVHFGNGLKGFSDQTIRNLMATIWTFEPQITAVHPQHRRENQEMAPNFRENSYLSDNGFRDPRKGLDLLLSDKANTIPELKRWSHARHIGLREGSKLAYHLGDVACVWDADDDLAKKTTEFREHESTLNKHAVISWIELCVRLVEFADDVTEDILFPFLRQHIEETPEQYQLGQLLCKLGLPELAKWYPLQIASARHKRS